MIVKRLPNPDLELYHHGIKGQKWGVRRYQNPDGSLTPEGYRRYNEIDNTTRNDKEILKAAGNKALQDAKTVQEKKDIQKIMDRDQKEISKMNALLKASITDKNIKKSEEYKKAQAYIQYIKESSLVSQQYYYNGMAWVTTNVYNYSVGVKNRANKEFSDKVKEHSQDRLNKTLDKYGKKKSKRAIAKTKKEIDRHNRALYVIGN